MTSDDVPGSRVNNTLLLQNGQDCRHGNLPGNRYKSLVVGIRW